MKVLIVGGGGREHALAWKCASAARVTEVLVAPGNAGTATEPKVRNVECQADDIAGLVRLAQTEEVDLTIIGPEGAAGGRRRRLVPVARAQVLRPHAQARAQLEGSKAFTKEFLKRHGIPTAAYATFTRDTFDPSYVQKQRPPIVVKASGLAAGKGVVIVRLGGGGHRRPRAPCSTGSSARRAMKWSSRNSSRARKRASS